MPQERIIPTTPPIASNVTFSIKVENLPVSRSIGISSIVVSKEVNKISKLSLSIVDGNAANSDFDISNQDLFIPGKKIEVSVGYNGQNKPIFSGVIITHSIKIRSNESLLLVQAADVAFKMTLNPKRKIFNNVSASDIIETIASEYSLQTEITSTSFKHAELLQYYATDWDYVQTVAEAAGLLCFCEDGKLVVKKPDLTQAPVLELLYGATIKEFNAEMDARYTYSGVQGLSWNSSNQELIDINATEPSLPDQGNLTPGDLSDVAQSDPYVFLHGGNLDEQVLQTKIDTQLLKSHLAKIRGMVKCAGLGAVKPGSIVALSGVGERFSGNSFVSAVRHEISGGLWETGIQLGLSYKWFAEENNIQPLPASGITPSVKGLQIGIVTQLEEDPDGEDRIKVKLPMVDHSGEGTWCKISLPDAGENRGFFFRPEIGDEVVLGFLNEDPNYAVVLGSLHSAAKPSPLKASDDNHEKGIVTRSQMKWIWNDDKKALNIETPGGNKVFISDEDQAINLEDQHGNKITMDSNGITIESVKDISLKAGQNLKTEAQMNTELKAGTAFNVSANASLEVSSSGTTTIKGSMVMIN